MVETGAVAIASFVYRANSNPKMIMIFPVRFLFQLLPAA
jgi:hypothetical protein